MILICLINSSVGAINPTSRPQIFRVSVPLNAPDEQMHSQELDLDQSEKKTRYMYISSEFVRLQLLILIRARPWFSKSFA
jgi:hypothetical protein